jgi:hypothetical protein
MATRRDGTEFEIVDNRPWGLQQYTGRDGKVRVTRRDPVTNTTMCDNVIRASLGKERRGALSRASVAAKKTAQSSDRGGDASRASSRPRAEAMSETVSTRPRAE